MISLLTGSLTLNGLMAVPNLIALIALAGVIAKEKNNANALK